MRSLLVCAAVLSGALAIFACSGGSGSTTTGSTVPVEQGQVTSPGGNSVSATISAATLGEDCGGSSGLWAGDCNAEAKGGCGGGCRASNVQIAFNSADGTSNAKVEIAKVVLVSATDGSEVAELKASAPQAWSTEGGYRSWDQTIAPKSDLKASYTLSSPAWSTFDKENQSYSAKFRLHVTVVIDGQTIVLLSQELSREPAAVT